MIHYSANIYLRSDLPQVDGWDMAHTEMFQKDPTMKSRNTAKRSPRILITVALVIMPMRTVLGHCDGLDGPVVTAAKKALDSNKVEKILIWVPASEESAVKEAFQKTLAVRRLSPEAKDLADMYFFETAVRIHRTAEGASYTGLKPAGRDLGPAIPAADKALQTDKIDPLIQVLDPAIKRGLKTVFENARKTQHFPSNDINKGREFVANYVEYIHFSERLYEAATKPAHEHYKEGEHQMEKEE